MAHHVTSTTPRLLAGLLFLAGLTGLASPPAQARIGDEELNLLLPLSLEELIATPVVTASRRAEGREQTPSHIMVFTREQIRDRRYKTLADLMEDLPGVDFQRGTRSSGLNYFVFQGHTSNNKLLILLDGVRIDHPVGGKVPVADNYSLHLARRVEVLYGPAAALYGADAFSGVINIITERGDELGGGKVAVSAGQFNSYDGNYLVGDRLTDNWSITAGGHRQTADRAPLDKYYPTSYPRVAARTSSGVVVVPAANRESYVGGTSSESQFVRIDRGEALTLSFYRNRFKSLTSTGDTTTAALFLPDAKYDTTVDTFAGKYRFDLSDSLKGELVVDLSNYQVNPEAHYVNVFTDFQNHGYDYAMSRRRGIEQNLNWTVNAQHTVLAGIGWHDYYAIETPDLSTPYRTAQGAHNQGLLYPNTTLPIAVFDTSYRSQSSYLQWQAQWSADFSTTLGLRRDWYSTYGASLNPRVGAVWQVSPGNYLKFLYGEAFRTPSPEEIMGAFGSFTGARNGAGLYLGSNFRVPNFNLSPEKSKTFSVTWDWRPRKDVNLVVNAYHTRAEDIIITTNETVSTQYIPGALLSRTTTKMNSGKDTYQGVDFIPQWQIRLGGAWNADLWGSYSYIKGTVQDAANAQEWEQVNIAHNKAKLGATLRYQDWLTITPRVQWIGDTNTGRKNTRTIGERLTAPGYTTASLHVGVHKLANGNLSAYLDIYNLLDNRYYNAHGSASSTLLAVPQQPRTVMATLEYRF